MLDTLRQDASYALRRLRQAPGFTLVATATLALGIGATSAVFSVVNAVLLRPLPFPEPDRLVQVAQTWKGRPAVYSPQNFLDVEAQATSFSGLAAVDTNGVTLTGQGTAARLEGAAVSASFFDVLRARPLHGRGFLAGENEPDRGKVAVSTIADRLARAYPADDEGVGGTVIPLLDATVGESRRALLVLLGAVGLVLLVACVNVANLLLARIAVRETELALRAALGAGRGRLVRQLLTESLVLAVLGGAAGLLLSVAMLDGLLALQPQGVPRLDEVSVNRTVVAFAGVLSLLTTVLFGAFPALQTRRRSSAQALRQGSRGILPGARGGLRGGLVVGQIALAMVLVAGSALLLRSFVLLRRVDPGLRTENALAFRISLPESAYADDARLLSFHDELQRRLAALPGVRSVGAVAGLPLSGQRSRPPLAGPLEHAVLREPARPAHARGGRPPAPRDDAARRLPAGATGDPRRPGDRAARGVGPWPARGRRPCRAR